jgi:hypothetical protein
LVVASFNKHKQSKELSAKAFKLVGSVSKSGKTTEALIALTGKKLVCYCITRWTTAYLVIHRMLEVKEALKKVLLVNNMMLLQPDEWNALTLVDKLLSKFAEYTNLEDYRTLFVIPCYLELKMHLEEMSKEQVVA